MTAYYMIEENALPLGRWILGDFRSSDFLDRRRLGNGEPCRGAFTIDPGDGGRALDFSFTAFGLPIATLPIANSISSIAGSDIHLVPARVKGYGEYRFIQCLRSLDCVDKGRSTFDIYEDDAPVPARRGEYSAFTKLMIDTSRVPPNAHMFFIEKWRVRPIVSEAVKDVLTAASEIGVKFVPATC
jgi:hypothetical protein